MTAGEIATELLSLVLPEVETLDDTGKRIVANRITEAFSEWASKPTATATIPCSKPMTDAEAGAFGGTSIRFGKHAGKRYDEVPLDYLEWLSDSSRKTWLDLHRYLNSPRIKDERREMESHE